jgi:hypothetical protein
MQLVDDALGLEEARAGLFADNLVQDDDGGYSASWAKVKWGPVTLAFPNSQARVRALRLHDFHHLATGYDMDFTGEAEIGAWEVAGGCADHTPAWLLNLLAMAIGLFVAPRRCLRAFVRGRQTRNLYSMDYEDVLRFESMGALRRYMCLEAPLVRGTPIDAALALLWSLVGLALFALALALLLAPLAALVWAVR